MIYGKYTLLEKENPSLYCYTRELDGKKFMVMLNFTDKTANCKCNEKMETAILKMNNYSTPGKKCELRPYEAVIYELK